MNSDGVSLVNRLAGELYSVAIERELARYAGDRFSILGNRRLLDTIKAPERGWYFPCYAVRLGLDGRWRGVVRYRHGRVS